MTIAKQFIASLLLTSIANLAQAAELDIPLTELRVWVLGGTNQSIVRVTTPGVSISNPEGCTNPDSYFVLTTMPVETQSRIYTTLTAARLAEKPVTIRINGCETNRPAIIGAYL